MRRHPSIAAASVLVALVFAGGRASAATPTSLDYTRASGAEACPDEAALRASVVRRLGSDPFTAGDAARRTIEVSITRVDASYRGVVRIRDHDGSIVADRAPATSTSCDDLLEALALTISVALDPSSLLREPEPATEEPPAPEPPPPAPAPPPPPAPAPPPPPARPAPRRAQRAPLVVSAGAGATLSAGDEPAPVAGGAIYGAVRRGILGAILEGRASASASKSTDVGPIAARSMSVLAGPCAHVGVAFGCACGEVVLLDARTQTSPDTLSVVFARVGARAGVAFPFGSDRFEIRANVDALATLGGVRLVSGSRSIYEWPFGRIGAGAALGVRF